MNINLFVKYLDDKTGGEKIAYYFAEYLYKQKIPFTLYCGKIKTKNVPLFAENEQSKTNRKFRNFGFKNTERSGIRTRS